LAIQFTQALTEEIPVWKQIAGIPDDKRSKIPDIRAGMYVCLEGEGLVILGYLGFELLTYSPANWRQYVSRLGQINWQESDPIWTSSIRQLKEKADPVTGRTKTTYKKLSAYSAVQSAIEKVRDAIGWSRPDPLKTRLPPEVLEPESQQEGLEEPAPAPTVALGPLAAADTGSLASYSNGLRARPARNSCLARPDRNDPPSQHPPPPGQPPADPPAHSPHAPGRHSASVSQDRPW